MRKAPLLVLAALVLSSSVAYAADPAAARAQLEAGYSLKEQGHFDEALPHLLESLRLDPQLKTLTNLADCEEHVGRLVDAQQHWLMARDRATAEQNARLKAGAEARLAALEARMPRLSIKLAPDAPAGTEVVRDGTALGAISVGTPLPANTGPHTIVARAAGLADRTFTVTLAEGEQKEIVVRPGDPLPAAAAVLVAPATSTDEVPPAAGHWSNQKTGAIVAGGVGVVGIALGAVFGFSTGSHWANAQQECGKGCGPSSAAQTDKSTAVTDGVISDVAFAVAGVAIATGIVLWVTAPHEHRPSPAQTSLAIVPGLGTGETGLTLVGTF